jgi:hypothetical protein
VTRPMAESRISYLERSCDDHCEGFLGNLKMRKVASSSVVQFKRSLEINLMC